MLALIRELARYNRWANTRLYDACAELSEQEYLRSRPAFFESIHGTLCHVLVADRVWLGRIQGKPARHCRLDEQPFDDLAGLRAARQAEDDRIVRLMDEVDEAELNRIVAYRTTEGVAYENRVLDLLAHFFNHQTHHRGQVHNQLMQTDVAPPALDLIFFMRETAS